MAMKHRVPEYDIGAESATRPDSAPAASDWDNDWSQPAEFEQQARELVPYGALAEPPPRWNEPTIPDLPLRRSMAAPDAEDRAARSAERAPRDTVTPRSGTRHRAVSEPPPKATSRREAVSSTMVPPAPAPAKIETHASSAPHPARRSLPRAPLIVAVTGLAAALGSALGSGGAARWLDRSADPQSALPVAAPVPRAPVSSANPKARALPPQARAATTGDSAAVPVVRFQDLPLAKDDATSSSGGPDASPRRRRPTKGATRH
jgi:hypothetical protein